MDVVTKTRGGMWRDTQLLPQGIKNNIFLKSKQDFEDQK